MAMVSIYHDTAYVVHTCDSTISNMRYALMNHCVQGVALYRPMACSSYAHPIHLFATPIIIMHLLFKA